MLQSLYNVLGWLGHFFCVPSSPRQGGRERHFYIVNTNSFHPVMHFLQSAVRYKRTTSQVCHQETGYMENLAGKDRLEI